MMRQEDSAAARLQGKMLGWMAYLLSRQA